MEATARAERASLIDTVILGKMHGRGWHKVVLTPSHPRQGFWQSSCRREGSQR